MQSWDGLPSYRWRLGPDLSLKSKWEYSDGSSGDGVLTVILGSDNLKLRD